MKKKDNIKKKGCKQRENKEEENKKWELLVNQLRHVTPQQKREADLDSIKVAHKAQVVPGVWDLQIHF